MKLDADILALETFDLTLGGVEYKVKQIDAEQYAAAIKATTELTAVKDSEPEKHVGAVTAAVQAWAPDLPAEVVKKLTMKQFGAILSKLPSWQQGIDPGDSGNVGGGLRSPASSQN